MKDQFSIPFTEIKNAVLGSDYELSLVFIDSIESRRLNRTYRKKDKPANVLSFPISKNLGEIFIDLEHARKEAGDFEKTFPEFVQYLFIHALLHLKGMPHGSKMERAENKLLKLYPIHATNRGGHRHRNTPSKSGYRGRDSRRK